MDHRQHVEEVPIASERSAGVPAETARQPAIENLIARQQTTPASYSPWYILATVHGEQKGERIDWKVHAQNRRTWNRWMSAALDAETRQTLIEKHGVDPDDLTSLEHERGNIETLTQQRVTDAGRPLPDPGNPCSAKTVDFGHAVFQEHFCADGFIFPGEVEASEAIFRKDLLFSGAHFRDEALFSDAHFRGRAAFDRATFLAGASFSDAKFCRSVSFIGTTFREPAWFYGATVWARAAFDRVTFQDRASFAGATFRRSASFGHATFEGSTNFDDVRFRESPDFRDAVLPFSTTWHHASWPKPRPSTAEDDTEHYAALRHAMDTAKRHDAELDFFVRELQAKRYTGIPWLQRLAIDGYLLLADGGRSFARPAIAWLLALLLVFLVEGVTLAGPAVFAIPSPLAFEALRLAFGSAIVVSVPMFDVRRMEQLRQALPDLTGQPLLPAGTSPLPDSIQLLGLAHAGFSALCLQGCDPSG